MIGYLKGTLIHQDHKSVILNVSGVGYKIYTNTGKVEGERLKVKSIFVETKQLTISNPSTTSTMLSINLLRIIIRYILVCLEKG